MSTQIPALHDSVSTVTQTVEQQSDHVVKRLQESNRNVQKDISDTLQAHFKQQQEELDSKFGQLFHMIQVNNQQQHSKMSGISGPFVAPSFLQEMCDGIEESKQKHKAAPRADRAHRPISNNTIKVPGLSSQLDSNMGWKCICNRLWRVAELNEIQLGHVYISSEREVQQHWPGCPQSKSAASRTRRAWRIRYTGLTHLLKAALDLTFGLTSGAGGFSISPNFNYTPTVNKRTDNAFKVLALIKSSFSWPNCTNRELLMTACHRKLVKIFEGKKAVPWSVDEENETLMQYTASLLQYFTVKSYWEPTGPAFFLELLQTLAQYGVPVFSYNTKGQILITNEG